MNKTIDALKLAEEAMTSNMRLLGAKALAAIREALAEQFRDATKMVAEPELNLNCKSVQARLATVWGYVKAEPEYYDCGGTIGVVHKSQCSAAMKRNGKPWKCVCGANLYIDSNGAPASKAEPDIEEMTLTQIASRHEPVKQEPVAWLYDWEHQGEIVTGWVTQDFETTKFDFVHNVRPLYAAPVEFVKQEPVAWRYNSNGDWIYKDRKVWDAAEPLYAAPVQPVKQEPVAWHEPNAYGNVTTHKKWALENEWLPLYTKE